MNKFQFKLQINFANDVKKIMLEKLKKGGFIFNSKLEVEELVRQYFNLLIRQIEINPRKVHLSKELSSYLLDERLKKGLATIVGASMKGMNLTPFLSREILKPEYKDSLLYDWGIHHLHLGHQLNEKDRRFITRTNELLFVKVELDDFYCIDILNHDPIDGFANKKLIEIIHQNWPHLLAGSKFTNIAQPAGNLTNEEIHNVRRAGAITFISTIDGTSYMPSGGGYATDGSSMLAMRQTDMLLGQISALEDGVKADDAVIRKAISDAGIRCPITINIRLTSWDKLGVLVTETKTKLELRLFWPT